MTCGRFRVAAAKLRMNMTTSLASAILPQVHGRIGFTEEDPLQLLPYRLYAWCSKIGALGGRAGARRSVALSKALGADSAFLNIAPPPLLSSLSHSLRCDL